MVLILELNERNLKSLQHSGLCQDQYAVCPWRIRRIQHLMTIWTRMKTNTAYYPQQYAVSRFNEYPSSHYTQYAVCIYPIRRIQDLTKILEGIKIPNVVPTPSQHQYGVLTKSIRRIDLPDRQLYKLIHQTISRRAQPQFRNPNSKKSIFKALEEQRRYSNALNSMGNNL